MDVYKLDQSIGSNLGNAPPPDKIQPQVTFDAGSEFNLSFFDNTDDHESTQGFSDTGSVGSAPEASPPPPSSYSQTQGGRSAASPSGSVQLQPPSSSTNAKQGRKRCRVFSTQLPLPLVASVSLHVAHACISCALKVTFLTITKKKAGRFLKSTQRPVEDFRPNTFSFISFRNVFCGQFAAGNLLAGN
ncbi:hypothetical protein RUM43_003022 [Polyplax serrata]|uniref:Uncharacterized protein n=1 Tax=Polyplax serrata TaxID=468196 RepID=A0AAN8NVU3_POLSC